MRRCICCRNLGGGAGELSQGSFLKCLCWWSAILPECQISRLAFLFAVFPPPPSKEQLSFLLLPLTLLGLNFPGSESELLWCTSRWGGSQTYPLPQAVSYCLATVLESPPQNCFFIIRVMCLGNAMEIHHQRQGNALIPEKENHDLLDCSLRTTDSVQFPICRLQR